jgi:uncharacterized protein YhdP
VAGEVLVTTDGTRGEFDHGSLVGIDMAKASLRVPRTFDTVELAASGSGDGKSLRELIDSSPLAGWLTFVKPDWTFAGPFDFAADLRVPVNGARAAR